MRMLMVAAVVSAVVGGGWWLARNQDPQAPPATAGHPLADRRPDESPVAPPPEPAGLPPANDEPFRERLRTFVAGASGLSEPERQAQAEALRRDTLAREADGSLLPAESAYIQLALLRATTTDQVRLRRRSEALLEDYQTATEQGWQAYRRRAAPRHEAYREAEAELIRRARQEDVSGEELRERLQALREQHYP